MRWSIEEVMATLGTACFVEARFNAVLEGGPLGLGAKRLVGVGVK